jgi:hypothetical protein
MKLAKYLSLVALLAAPFTVQLNAQVANGLVAGSSAVWIESGLGAAAALASPPCVWTDNTGTNSWVLDVRPGVGVKDFGKLWVAWDVAGGSGCGSPGTAATVYAYISVDSGISNRCLFAVPQCTLNTSDAAGNPGTSPDPLALSDTPLPLGVLNAFNGKPINIASTDIMPLDSLFSTFQGLSPCGLLSSGTQYQGYGRGAWPGPGQQIVSQAGTIFNVVGWQITGTDPFSGAPAAGTYTITPVAATPLVVFVNTSDAAGFGNPAITNVDRLTLGLAETNILARTSDFIPQDYNAVGGAGVTYWHREPLSGAFNVFERGIPDNKEIYRTQEQVCPPVDPEAYGRTVDGFTSNNLRASGNGEMIGQVYATVDSIGYAFWTTAAFKAATYGGGVNPVKYLTVDGVDPLFAAYSTVTPGEIPTPGNGLFSSVTLQNVANGSYPLWAEERFVTTNAVATSFATLLSGWAQPFSTVPGGTLPDFIPATNLHVIHSHFSQVSYGIVNDAFPTSEGPSVCGAGGPPEAGGDAGGLVHTLQAGSDFAVLKGNYNTAACTGITNAASFGVHQ